jgi:hypothetical protein
MFRAASGKTVSIEEETPTTTPAVKLVYRDAWGQEQQMGVGS